MSKVLVLCVDYPAYNRFSMQYVHVRNLYYLRHNIKVEVLNFSTSENYQFEGIDVITKEYFESKINHYKDYVLICHAPNIRNHYMFVRKYKDIFKKVIFVFHGHEIVEQYKVYPEEYFYNKKNNFIRFSRILYDKLKIKIWERYFKIIDKKSQLIFVSEFLYEEFVKNLGMKEIRDRCYIINNSVGQIFQEEKYDETSEKEFDYITIRTNIDSSVYCIDLINKIANAHLDKKFLLIGKGDYFKYNDKALNITYLNGIFKQSELIEYINKSKVALMPTRRDSQGVMACELATFGIPVITSTLEVCQEMFHDFENVILKENEMLVKDLDKCNTINSYKNNEKFYFENTVLKEIEVIQNE